MRKFCPASFDYKSCRWTHSSRDSGPDPWYLKWKKYQFNFQGTKINGQLCSLTVYSTLSLWFLIPFKIYCCNTHTVTHRSKEHRDWPGTASEGWGHRTGSGGPLLQPQTQTSVPVVELQQPPMRDWGVNFQTAYNRHFLNFKVSVRVLLKWYLNTPYLGFTIELVLSDGV